MRSDEILINHNYRMKSGAICKVDALTQDGKVFLSCEGETPGGRQQMTVEEFAASVED